MDPRSWMIIWSSKASSSLIIKKVPVVLPTSCSKYWPTLSRRIWKCLLDLGSLFAFPTVCGDFTTAAAAAEKHIILREHNAIGCIVSATRHLIALRTQFCISLQSPPAYHPSLMRSRGPSTNKEHLPRHGALNGMQRHASFDIAMVEAPDTCSS